MPGENLTKVEALTRSQLITVKNYEIDLDLREVTHSTTFRSTTRVTFLAETGQSSFIDAIAHSVHRVVLNGTELDPAEVYADSRIQLPGLRADNSLEIEADFSYTNSGEGLHKFVDPVDDETYLYTQFEVPDSRRVFAVFEQPDIKGTFQFTIHAPAHWAVVSNQPTPEPQPTENGATWTFSSTPRISSYITALIAGPYAVVRDELVSSSGIKGEVDKGVRALAQSALARLDVVSREEFDAQADILKRTRAKVVALEAELEELTKELEILAGES